MHRSCLLLLLLCTPLAASRAQDMPHSIAEAQALERQDALPTPALYANATLGNSQPGDLLGQQTAREYTLPLGAAVRIVYHSRDVAGRDVATTAAVLLPKGTAPPGGWPVIAWAHGTSGVARQCAPSLMKDVYYGDEGLKQMLEGGFAVVATDYHGLGGPGAHPWVSKQSQAQDVIYSVPAARKAIPSLGRRWVADGHSQGGLAAWGVAELESKLADPDYLGAISVAGALRLEAFMEFMDRSQGGLTMYLGYMAWALHTRFPEFRPEDLLTPQAMKLYGSLTTEGCWYYGYAAFRDMPREGVLQRTWRTNPFVARLAQENLQGEQRISKPLLVLAGEADMSVPIAGVREVVSRACAQGSPLEFKSYPGLDHDPTMSHSMPDQLAWLRDRFAAKPAHGSCPRN